MLVFPIQVLLAGAPVGIVPRPQGSGGHTWFTARWSSPSLFSPVFTVTRRLAGISDAGP